MKMISLMMYIVYFFFFFLHKKSLLTNISLGFNKLDENALDYDLQQKY